MGLGFAPFVGRRALTLCLVVVAAALTASVALAAAGDLDPNFGTGGKVVTNISTRDEIHAVALQSDGKVLGVGWAGGDFSTADFAVARYTKDGALDATYGSGGVVVTDLGGADIGLAAAVQSDGKLLVGGATGQAPTFEGNTALVRYNTDGTLDSTFGTAGVVINDFGGDEEWSGLAVLKSGKILASGFTGATVDTTDFLLARFNSDGTLDTTFGCATPPCAGWTSTDFGAGEQAYGLAVESDGKIVVAGVTDTGQQTAGDFALARYTANGVLDPNFGSGGKVVTDIGGPNVYDIAHSVGVVGSGKIVAAGTTRSGGSNFVVARYTASGALDPDFGCASPPCSGYVVGPGGGASSVALQKDTRIVVGGVRNQDFALARYTADGILDSTFGSGGVVTTDIGTSSSDGIEGLAIQPKDGKIVAGGWSNSGSGRDFTLARYSG